MSLQFKITKPADKQPTHSIALEGYVIEITPTAANCGGALLYINKNINFKLRNYLKIYKEKELESVFIEIINKKEKKYYHRMHIQTSLYGSNRV